MEEGKMNGCDQGGSGVRPYRHQLQAAATPRRVIETRLCDSAAAIVSSDSSCSGDSNCASESGKSRGDSCRRDAVQVCSSPAPSQVESIATCLCVPYGDIWDDRATYRLRDLDLPSVRSSWRSLLHWQSAGATPTTPNMSTRQQQRLPRHLHLESKGFGVVPGALAWLPDATLVKHLIQLKIKGNGEISTEHDELASLTHEECESSVDFLTELVSSCEGSLKSMSVKLSQEEYREDERAEIEDTLTTIMSHSDCLRHLEALSMEGFEGRDVMELLLDQLIVQGRKCHLKSLDLKHFGANNISLLIPFLESYSGLGEVSIAETNLEAGRVFPSLAQTLSHQSSCLRHLTLSSASLTADSSLACVAQIMERQQDLISLDLSGNTSLFESIEVLIPDDEEEDFSLIDYRRKPQGMESFSRALANHSSLQELNMDNCSIGNESFACLLSALTKNKVLRKMWVDMRRLSIDSSWVCYLPSLRLPCLYGFRSLTCQASWIPKVVPALRENTFLTEIEESDCSIEIAVGSPAATKVSNTTGAFFVDAQTKQILTRNKYLAILGDGKGSVTLNPSLPLWPRLLQQLASPRVDGSALYSFLKANSPNVLRPASATKRRASFQDLGNDSLLRRLRRMEEENKRLRYENDWLKHVQHKNDE